MKSIRAIAQNGAQAIELAMRRFTALGPLNEDERKVIAGLDRTLLPLPAGADFIEQGGALREPRMIVSGWACRYRALPDGRRQILSFLMPGDAYGLCLRAHPLALTSALALTDLQTIMLTPVLRAAQGSDPRFENLRRAVHVGQAIDEALLIENVVRVGRRTAYERLCHLFLELHHRLAALGLAEGDRFPMPLTQEALADALGLSIVHVNRTLQQMRRDQLIDLRGGFATLLNPALLVAIADFRPPQPQDWREPLANHSGA